MEEVQLGEEEINKATEVAPALISVHPFEKSVVVALGSELRVFDLEGDCSISLSDDSGGPSHSGSIRAICFDASGRLFASAGDEKLVKIWMTDSWRCIRTVCADKRVSAVAISHDGLFVVFADKFGVVWAVSLDGGGEGQALCAKKPVPILGHYCSIITTLKFSPDGRFIASADRDFKIRVTIFPREPLKGAHEIQSFCLGHTDFVSCLAFVCPSDYPLGFLLSGSGDSTVRLWDFNSGCLLATCEVGHMALESNEIDKGNQPAVTDISSSPDGALIAVSIQSFHGVMLLNCNFSAKSLSVAKVVSMKGSYVPTNLCVSSLAKHLWTVMGASNQPSSGTTQLARVRVCSISRQGSSPHGHNLLVLEDNDAPGGEKLLSKLQGSSDVTKIEATLASTTSALKMAIHNLLTKKQYSSEKREFRKRNRNDRKQRQ
ncbi:putative transcription factor WD40-like family [Dioscorea sansibarensis]